MIESKLEAVSTSTQEWGNQNSFSESDEYCYDLLKLFENKTSLQVSATLLSEDGQVVRFPLPVLSLAWPNLGKLVSEVLCCSSDIVVCVPCQGQTLLHLKELIYDGFSSQLDPRSENLLFNFLADVGLEFNVVRSYKGESLEEETLVIGDEYDESEEDEGGEESNVGDELFVQFRQPVRCQAMVARKECEKLCANECPKFIESLSDESKNLVKEIFSGKSIETRKTKMLNFLDHQHKIGAETDSYVILGHAFCLQALSSITSCSVYLLRKVLEDYWKGVSRYDHGNLGIMKNPSMATTSFICWFKNFLALYGQSAPDDQVIILNYWLKGKVLYKMYLSEAPAPHVALTTFYQHLKTYFGPKRIDQTLPCHRVSKYSSHSVCDICCALNSNKKFCRTDAELSMTTALMNQHKIDFGMARQAVESLRQSAIDFPNDSCFIQLDGMDNSKSYLPRFLEKSKNLVGTERLPSKITGCIIWSGFYHDKRKDIFYINHDQFGGFCIILKIIELNKICPENGSDMVITIIYHLLREFIEDHGKLPRKLHLNLGKF